jgi:hypothetical protein
MFLGGDATGAVISVDMAAEAVTFKLIKTAANNSHLMHSKDSLNILLLKDILDKNCLT